MSAGCGTSLFPRLVVSRSTPNGVIDAKGDGS